MNNNKDIIKIKGKENGKKLAVFCGVHGNELSGIIAVKKILTDIKNKKIIFNKGEVVFVFANPKAIEKNIRQNEKNLNRCFYKNNIGTTYEDKRARELMVILDNSDALLDLHSSTNNKTNPFAATEKNSFDIVSKMDLGIVVENFDEYEPGATDAYMSNDNKIGITLELSEESVKIAYKSILQFLQYFNIIDKIIEYDNKEQQLLRVDGVIFYDDESFQMSRSFYDFEVVKKGTLVAESNKKKYIMDRERVILFGVKAKRNIGDEACILGTWVIKK